MLHFRIEGLGISDLMPVDLGTCVKLRVDSDVWSGGLKLTRSPRQMHNRRTMDFHGFDRTLRIQDSGPPGVVLEPRHEEGGVIPVRGQGPIAALERA